MRVILYSILAVLIGIATYIGFAEFSSLSDLEAVAASLLLAVPFSGIIILIINTLAHTGHS